MQMKTRTNQATQALAPAAASVMAMTIRAKIICRSTAQLEPPGPSPASYSMTKRTATQAANTQRSKVSIHDSAMASCTLCCLEPHWTAYYGASAGTTVGQSKGLGSRGVGTWTHLHAGLHPQDAPPVGVGGPEGNIGCKVVDDARHDRGHQGPLGPRAQRDEQLR